MLNISQSARHSFTPHITGGAVLAAVVIASALVVVARHDHTPSLAIAVSAILGCLIVDLYRRLARHLTELHEHLGQLDQRVSRVEWGFARVISVEQNVLKEMQRHNHLN